MKKSVMFPPVKSTGKGLTLPFIGLAVVFCLLLSLFSCSGVSKYEDTITENAAPEASYDTAMEASGSSTLGTKNNRFSYTYDRTEEEAETTPQTQRKIIYSSYFNIQTAQFDAAITALDALCEKYGAYYERSDTYGNAEQGNRSGSYTIRVPVEEYKAFRDQSGTVGTVIHATENNEDVSETYFDTEARLSSAKMREERLLDILSKAETLDNVLLLEAELADVRYEIESLSGSLRRYDSLISYSTVNIDIHEVMKPALLQPMPKSFGERLSQSIESGFRDFGNAVEDFLVDVSYALPCLILFVLVIIILILIVKIILRKVKKLTKPTASRTSDLQETELSQPNTDKS